MYEPGPKGLCPDKAFLIILPKIKVSSDGQGFPWSDSWFSNPSISGNSRIKIELDDAHRAVVAITGNSMVFSTFIVPSDGWQWLSVHLWTVSL